ncbi:N-acetyltransferase family protein [Adlercreutzia sp. ZJ473]|uniref:GNAT family N-acetyltransferase n=1 Tax=Adlercreutzia sp. ZJ473 TaxID=2722822 RepID=UPI00352FF6B8
MVLAMEVRAYTPADLVAMIPIWNEVVRDGRAFPQLDELDEETGAAFFAAQSYAAVAVDGGRVIGLAILHPNNVGRCSHVANASFAVSSEARGRGVGRALVADALAHLVPCGFRGLQFNAVVASNARAIRLYESLGFTRVGTIPGGFLDKEGAYEDMHVFYHEAAGVPCASRDREEG